MTRKCENDVGIEVEKIDRAKLFETEQDEASLGTATNGENGKKILTWLIQQARKHGLKLDIAVAHDLDGNILCIGDGKSNMEANASALCAMFAKQFTDRSKCRGSSPDPLADHLTASLFAIVGIFIHDKDEGINQLFRVADALRALAKDDDGGSSGNDKNTDSTEDGEWRINDD